jgi:GTP:adenosylcobinamide-phosphate guanylyltransferase
VPRKALIRVAGTPMLARVLAALRSSRSVAGIAICGVDRGILEAGGIAAGALDEVVWLEAAAQPSDQRRRGPRTLGGERPVLVTTADHPLLTAEIVDDVLRRSRRPADATSLRRW